MIRYMKHEGYDMSTKIKTTAPVKDLPKHVDVIELSEAQVKELAEANAKAVALKCRICDLTEQLIVAERQRGAMYDELYKAQAEWAAKVNKFASRYGIDVDAKPEETGERWTFDSDKGTFTRSAFLPPGTAAPAPDDKPATA